MTKETEETTVLEKASSLVRKMISASQDPVTPVENVSTTPVGSPRTLAVKCTEIEIEYLEQAGEMHQAIKEKEEELNSAKVNMEHSEEVLRIEAELKVLKVFYIICLL